jgi:hypothetical protein
MVRATIVEPVSAVADRLNSSEAIPSPRKKILAVSSGGGHWVQLLRLAPAFKGHDVVYVTVNRNYRGQVGMPGSTSSMMRPAGIG